MKTIYFDCFAGASGDMIAGVFLDLGLDFGYLKAELLKLPIDGYELKHSKVSKNSIISTQFEVYVASSDHSTILADSEFSELNDQNSDHAGHHLHAAHSHESHHSLDNILTAIRNSKFDAKLKSNIEKVFLRLGQAEATVHGVNIHDIHLHEVGSIDAMIDISTAVIGFEWLQANNIILSPIHLGTGFITTSHGLLPIPAPATAELIKGIPVYTTSVKGELLTPTGAAILSCYATGFGGLPKMTVEKIGCGAGKRDRDFPNVLRAFVGEIIGNGSGSNRNPSPEQHRATLQPGGYHEGEALMLVANIDDMNPQLYGNLMEKLLEAGVMDVTFTPIFMKKNRPATSLDVMIAPQEMDKILAIIFSESTTIGVRSYPVKKHMLQREILTIDTEYGPVRMKISRLSEQIVNYSPEYEDCVRIGETYRIPVKDVYAKILSYGSSLLTNSSG
jgi:pyridinium-3,5-bisthiocarboxylic acid mononucleotide nickel chelatase